MKTFLRRLFNALETYCKEHYLVGAMNVVVALLLPWQVYKMDSVLIVSGLFCLLSVAYDVRKIWKRGLIWCDGDSGKEFFVPTSQIPTVVLDANRVKLSSDNVRRVGGL